MKLKAIIMILVMYILAGCGQHMMPMLESPSSYQHVDEKSYTLKAEHKTYVGNSMIRVRDYEVSKRTTDKLVPSEDFTIGIQQFSLSGKKGTPISIAGKVIVEGETYYLIQSEEYKLLFPISSSGEYLGGRAGRIVGGFHSGKEVVVSPRGNWKFSPSTVKFSLAQIEEVDSTKGYTNFELVYTGHTENSFNIMYREFTRDDLARPAYYQNLTYKKQDKIIRFKNIKINIIEATSEYVRFAVLEDK